MEKTKAEKIKRKYTLTQLILMILATAPGNCASLNELQEKTSASKNTLLVYLTRLANKGVIYRRWTNQSGKMVRLYCLKYKRELLS